MQQHINVGGYRLRMQMLGHGAPTVVLETGSCWSGIDGWRKVMPEVAKFTCVVTYDRAGLGESDKAPTPRTWQDMVRDLATLLDAATISGPYVLVGASSGGILVRLFAEQYPNNTAGMVLVDATNPRTRSSFLNFLPPVGQEDSQMLQDFRRWFTIQTGGDPGVLVEDIECVDWRASMPAALALKPIGSLPLTVLTAGVPAVDLKARDLPIGLGARMHEEHLSAQRELASLSTNSIHIVIEDSRHMIAFDYPDVVIDAIRQMVLQLR